MSEYENLYDFQNLLKAHKRARLGKQGKREVIDFEMNLSQNLCEMSEEIKNESYHISGYYSFNVYEPKERTIHALHYRDRVVQHCLCDEIIAPLFERNLIYDNAACRKGKGTLFAIRRLSEFLRTFCREHGNKGYFLKCDIRKFFDNIDHEILKDVLTRKIADTQVLALCEKIIDSYETAQGKGLPLGNQTSQWFALIYLDGFDRLCKEQLHLRFYTKYMDDMIIVHESKAYLHDCLAKMRDYAEDERKLQFNQKTQIFPVKNGVEYLGFRFSLSKSGAVIRRLKTSSKLRYRRKLRSFMQLYRDGNIELEEIRQSLSGYHGHMKHGSTFHLKKKALSSFSLRRSDEFSEL